MDWALWRLLLSDRLSVSKEEIEERWTMADVWDAHFALDAVDDVEYLLMEDR